MKSLKLTKEEVEQLSYTDVANLVLINNGKKMQVADLFKEVIKVMELPESYFESKITEFFGLLSTDKRFTMLEKGFWDLKDNHKSKVVIEEEDEDEIIESEEEEEEEIIEDEENEEVNYDDEDLTDDDEEEDAYKDLVIMNEGEEEEEAQ